MSEQPPQLGEIPQTSDFHVPTLATTGETATPHASDAPDAAPAVSQNTSSVTSSLESAKNSEFYPAQSAMDSVANHPITQNVKETVTNGQVGRPESSRHFREKTDPPAVHSLRRSPSADDRLTRAGPVAQNVKDQSAKTSAEASKLAATRKTPSSQTTTGQPLTHYHSFFYSLLTWEQPRVTAISYATVVSVIFIARYVPILRLSFKLLAYVLGTTALTEGISQLLLSQSLIAAVRPRKYYTIPRVALESTLEDVEQLLNFFVIESQRLVFAEDASKTFVAFLAAFAGYWLIKFTPLWGLGLITVTTIYMVPLIYITNKEIIDDALDQASKVVNAQTAQIKDIAATHTANATESLKGYAGDYTAKAQELIGGARRNASPAAEKPAAGKTFTERDFPTAPQQEPAPSSDAPQARSEFATAVPAS